MTAYANQLAERRRLRKLENQRLEEAARQRQEELQRQQEAERKHLDDERIAEEQRRLQEREEIRRKKAEEEERIANLELVERQVIAGIEKQLELVGAFWTSTLHLPGNGEERTIPICAALITVRALEKPILGLEGDVILVGDNAAKIHGFDRAFVQTIGRKGRNGGEFYDLRDVKLANVRKRAITRGVQSESDIGITNEHFEAVVADCGNYRVQILNERGEFLRQLSLLGSLEQITFQHDQFANLRAELEREYAALRESPPILSGERMGCIYSLATLLHPTCQLYARLTSRLMEWREKRSRFHHPFALAYAPSEREIVVVDRENASVYTYNFDAAGCTWLQLPKNQLRGVCSVHSCLQLSFTFSNPEEQTKDSPKGRWLYVSDPIAHRVAVLDSSNLTLQFFIGATTYGDQELLNASHHSVLVVSDSGNHTVSLFNARNGINFFSFVINATIAFKCLT
ncbi:hypothetical protein JG688_00000059 [Phytophthora aleatoria]|uniref:Uncharacterized protein n=1 Tax=Phytophthora aleatoria TaxID=2496075 RepID=A0A8J5MJ81_9STRA|nr:hypothetical protein JG688_00000059 [Phytophthora aleatoria]